MSIVAVDAVQWFEWHQWEDDQGVVHDITRVGLASTLHRVRCTGFLKEQTPYISKTTTCLGCVAQRGEAFVTFSKVGSVIVNAKAMAKLRAQYVEDVKELLPLVAEPDE
jgi:hypothetical protein